MWKEKQCFHPAQRHNNDRWTAWGHLPTWSLGDGLRRNWSRKKGEQAASTTLCPLNVWLLLATMVMSQKCWRDLSVFMCFRVVSPWPGKRKHSISISTVEKRGRIHFKITDTKCKMVGQIRVCLTWSNTQSYLRSKTVCSTPCQEPGFEQWVERDTSFKIYHINKN